MRLPRCAFLLLVFTLITNLSARSASTRIKVGAPTVEYKTFPVGRPPLHSQGVGQGEAGLCQTELVCKVGVEAEVPQTGLGATEATLTSVSFTIGAKITIWCQEGYNRKIIDHEETHRAISEHYYAMADEVARRLADDALARPLPLAGKPGEEALNNALKQLRTRLLDEFVRRISARSGFAQDRFDAITDHGRNELANKEAKTRALREEMEHWEKQAGRGAE